jgi:hypothetical protein
MSNPNTTPVSICNMALGYAGVTKQISSLTDGSTQAQVCNTYFDAYVRQLLAAFHWPWATRRANLTVYSGNTWSSATAYTAGALVQFGNNIYRCLLANTNAEPDLSPAQWFQVTRDGWGYCAPLPPDCISPICAWESPNVSAGDSLRPYYFGEEDQGNVPGARAPISAWRTPFALEDAQDGTGQQVLLCDMDTPVLKYVAYVVAPGTPIALNAISCPSMSDLFVDALSYKLGVALNAALRADPSKATVCEQMYRAKLAEAISGANRDQQEDSEPMSEFEAARMGIL